MGAREGSGDFGGQLRRHREAAGLSQEESAERAALTAKAMSALERGERQRPYPPTVRALADALNRSDADRSALIASVPNRVRPQRSDEAISAHTSCAATSVGADPTARSSRRVGIIREHPVSPDMRPLDAARARRVGKGLQEAPGGLGGAGLVEIHPERAEDLAQIALEPMPPLRVDGATRSASQAELDAPAAPLVC
jgi:DNA-binding XRE family transcriptional regulator